MTMIHQPKNFDHLLGMPGFSNQLLKNHFKLYEGYVENTKKLITLMKKEKMESPGFWEFKRRFGWEFNGMRLHEYYFNNMVKKGRSLEKDTRLFRKMSKDYGAYQKWEKEFIAMGSMRGIGWVILTYDHSADCLLNVWINEHDVGHLVGTTPLLVMDVFEHAFMIDYGIKRGGYIHAFFEAVNWIEVQDRYEISQENGYQWTMKKEILQ